MHRQLLSAGWADSTSTRYIPSTDEHEVWMTAPQGPKGYMTQEELFKLHRDGCERAHELMKRKNADYADELDALRNFNMFGREHALLGICFRAGDKWSRAFSYALRGSLSVTDESINDTLIDAINYPILGLASLEQLK